MSFEKCRGFLLDLVLSSKANRFIERLQKLYGVRPDGTSSNKFFHYYFLVASMFGDEVFFLIPLFFWFFYPVAVWVMTNFIFMIILGQLAKEVFKLPRPPATGWGGTIVKLEGQHGTEYGLPSTHTMLGFVPLSVALKLESMGYEVSFTMWCACYLVLWSVPLSRLYLGVHSLVDITGGFLLGGLIVYFLMTYGDDFAAVVYQSEYGIYYSVVSLMLFIVAYPQPHPWTASFGTSGKAFGLWFGVASAIWSTHHKDTTAFRILEESSLLSAVYDGRTMLSMNMCLRAVIGISFLLLVEVFLKWAAKGLFLSCVRRGFIQVELHCIAWLNKILRVECLTYFTILYVTLTMVQDN